MAEINDQMSKLVIQIPCFNEEQSLPEVLSQLPRKLPGVSKVLWLLIDDGSTDRTVEIARQFRVDEVVQLEKHSGLATAFCVGLKEAIKMGADIIVNTDGDNQYVGSEIRRLIEPILEGDADMVVGSRRHSKLDFLPTYKKVLYRIAGRLVSWFSGQNFSDPTSGFRAFSREFASNLTIKSHYTYTIESIIFAAFHGYHIENIDILTNQVKRPSRLIRNIPEYIFRSAFILAHSVMFYFPVLVQRKLNPVVTIDPLLPAVPSTTAAPAS